MSDHSAFNPGRLAANIIAVMAAAIGGAFLLDRATAWLGGTPWAVCAAMPVISLVLGHTVGMILAIVGLVGWTFSGFRSTSLLLLFLAGMAIGVAPGVIAQYLGASCPLP